jgi:DNA-binding MarR family transcriptional regulator
MATKHTVELPLDVVRDTMIASVRRNGPDLTSRQLAVLLIGYLDVEPQTVRGLAEKLDVSKPAISRSLDRLTELGLAGRKPDPEDRRSVLMALTASGRGYLKTLGVVMVDAAKAARRTSKAGTRATTA